MVASTGAPVLDEALNGGLPAGRTVLFTGGPGTGKSTLAMQFLQAGLDAGENCLYVSTEQTGEELRESFAPFGFDLGADGLTISSIHASQGDTIEEGDTLTLQTFEAENTVAPGVALPFEPQYVVEQLSALGPADRVVVDSISGLSAMADDQDRYRRAVFDLIRLFNDEFGATTVFTAEESAAATTDTGVRRVAAADAVQFNTHGVVRLYRETVAGDYHRFVEVVKMRGVDHDTRVFEIDFDDRGVRTYPRLRTHPGEFVPSDHLPTGIDGLDHLLGGGVILGGSVLLQHDGEAGYHSVLTNLIGRAIEQEMGVVLVPPVELPPKRLRGILEARVGGMDGLMDDDRLFLIDFPNIWQNTRRNVFKPTVNDQGLDEVFETVDDRRGDRSVLSLLNVEAQLPMLSDSRLRRARFWEEENFLGPEDTSLYFFNPATMDGRLAAFYKNGAWQVLETWVEDNGLQYLKLKKSPTGYMGSTRLVEYSNEVPYMHVQRPPAAGSGTRSRGSGAGRTGDPTGDP